MVSVPRGTLKRSLLQWTGQVNKIISRCRRTLRERRVGRGPFAPSHVHITNAAVGPLTAVQPMFHVEHGPDAPLPPSQLTASMAGLGLTTRLDPTRTRPLFVPRGTRPRHPLAHLPNDREHVPASPGDATRPPLFHVEHGPDPILGPLASARVCQTQPWRRDRHLPTLHVQLLHRHLPARKNRGIGTSHRHSGPHHAPSSASAPANGPYSSAATPLHAPRAIVFGRPANPHV